jgi:chitodextrinase
MKLSDTGGAMPEETCGTCEHYEWIKGQGAGLCGVGQPLDWRDQDESACEVWQLSRREAFRRSVTTEVGYVNHEL